MGIFGRISDIFQAKPNTELYPEVKSIRYLFYQFQEFSFFKKKLVSAIAIATKQHNLLKLHYLSMLGGFLTCYDRESTEDQVIEHEYLVNYAVVSQYKLMMEQSYATLVKLKQQRQKVLDDFDIIVQELTREGYQDLLIFPKQFLHFEKFAEKVHAWEHQNN